MDLEPNPECSKDLKSSKETDHTYLLPNKDQSNEVDHFVIQEHRYVGELVDILEPLGMSSLVN